MKATRNNPFALFEGLEPYETLDGVQTIKVLFEGCHGFVPPVQFANGGHLAMKTLERFNIAPLPETRSAIMVAIKSVKEFPVGNYLAKPGSTPPHFALVDRTVFGPTGAAAAEAIFPISGRPLSQSGTYKDWKKFVAKPLAGNPRVQALVALPFAAIIAELYEGSANVGFELVGAPATGKTTALMLAASAVGAAVDRETSYLVSLNATSNGLETIVSSFANGLLILEEGQLFNASDTPKMRATKWRELGHRLADGSSKLRGKADLQEDQAPVTSTPLWFLLNSNETLFDILGGGETDADKAVLQRIQALPASGKFGVYDRLPKGFVGGAAFSDYLRAQMRLYHGTAVRAFIPKLLKIRHADEAALRNRIAGYVAEFEAHVGLDPNDGEAARAAKAFGLIYVALRLAIHFKILPKTWNARKIALQCHGINRTAVLGRRPLTERLKSYASRRDVVRLERGKLPNLTDKELAACPGFVRLIAGQTVLMLSVEAYKRAFPDWRRLKGAAKKLMVFDKDGRHHPKQRVRSNGSTVPRLVTFDLS